MITYVVNGHRLLVAMILPAARLYPWVRDTL